MNGVIEWMFQQVGFAVVAAVALYMLIVVWKQYTRDIHLMYEQLLDAHNANTKALTELTETLRKNRRDHRP